MTRVLAIDPGSAESAWILLEEGIPVRHARQPNDEVLDLLRRQLAPAAAEMEPDVVVIENIEPRYGIRPGWEVLDTARWVGRFQEAASPLPVELLRRSEILAHLGVATRGENRTTADAGVRDALMDRFGGSGAVGNKAAPGPLYGITRDRWAALSVAVTWLDRQREGAAR